MTSLNPSAQRRLLLRYIDDVERTGVGVVPALERHLCQVYALSRSRPQVLPEPESTLAIEPGALQPQGSKAGAGEEAQPAAIAPASSASVTSSEDATIQATTAQDTPVQEASVWHGVPRSVGPEGATTYVAIANLIPTDPGASRDPSARDAAIDVTASSAASAAQRPELQPQAVLPAAHQPAERHRALQAFAKEVRRTGVCDHPALEARLMPLQLEPALARGDSSTALQAAIQRAWVQFRQLERLVPLVSPDAEPQSAEIEPEIAGPRVTAALVQGLRSLRQLLRDTFMTFGTGLQGPLRRLITRQLRAARWLEWRLQVTRRLTLNAGEAWPLATAMLETLRVVLELWSSAAPPLSPAAGFS